MHQVRVKCRTWSQWQMTMIWWCLIGSKYTPLSNQWIQCENVLWRYITYGETLHKRIQTLNQSVVRNNSKRPE